MPYKPVPPNNDTLVPLDVKIDKAIREGYYMCRVCYSCKTTVDANTYERRCDRCGSYKTKFIQGIEEAK